MQGTGEPERVTAYSVSSRHIATQARTTDGNQQKRYLRRPAEERRQRRLGGFALREVGRVTSLTEITVLLG
jgi:hypothetical protein